jgi:hypothetical protein
MCCAVLTACSGNGGHRSASSLPPAHPSGPSVKGRFIAQTVTVKPGPTPGAWPETVYEVWQFDVGTGAGPKASLLARPLHGTAAVSPDGRWLAYVTTTSLVMRNLADGQRRTVASKGSNQCLSWAPDSRRLVTALGGGVDLVDLSGSVTPVDRYRAAKYTNGKGARTVNGEITCPQWLDENRFVYDRLTHFPRVLSVYEADADTTTVAIVQTGHAPRLVDSAGRWTLAASCGQWLITTNGKYWQQTTPPTTPYLLDSQETADVTGKNGAQPSDRTITGLSGRRSWTAAFTPGDCRPVISDGESVYTIDVAGRHVQPRPLARNVDKDVFLHGFAWSPQPHADTFATANNGGRIYDLRTGGTTALHVDGVPSLNAILAWLPAPS